MSDTTPGGTGPQLVEVQQLPTLVVKGAQPMAQLGEFFDRSFDLLARAMASRGIVPTTPAFALYHGPPTDVADLEVGFVVDSPAQADGEVAPSSLPGGRVARMVHEGGYEGLGDSWGRLVAWIGEQGLAPGPVLWEVYLTQPTPETDPATLRTELNCTVVVR